MSDYSRYRTGNFIWFVTKAQRLDLYSIEEISSNGTSLVYSLRSQINHELIVFSDKPRDLYYPVIVPVELNPTQFGFSQLDGFRFSNGIIDLQDKTQVTEEDDSSDIFITKFSVLGYAVRRHGENVEYLFEPTWNEENERHEGITQVHELQNVFAELLPEIELNIQRFVELNTP